MKASIAVVLLLLSGSNISYGQPGKADTVNRLFNAGARVIFEDNFNRDSSGKFPAKWHVAACDQSSRAGFSHEQYCNVQIDGSEHLIAMKKTAWYIAPNTGSKEYLPDNFTVEFDFKFDGSGCAELCFYPHEAADSCDRVLLHVLSHGQVRKTGFSKDGSNIPLGSYPVEFDGALWHHYTVVYNKGTILIDIDRLRIAKISDCKFSPYALSLGCIAPVRYKHFKITTQKQGGNFNAIITEKRFTTHAINFAVNSSVIDSGSIGYIKQLAEFLQSNPDVKLEIGGHTDSDGDADANLRLSEERALAIKMQLISGGIKGYRLSCKGYGATKPLQPNTTKENKANNRRVEFTNISGQ